MTEKQQKGLSKFLNYTLRYPPEQIGLTLEANEIKFYRSKNHVWLKDYIAPEFIEFES